MIHLNLKFIAGSLLGACIMAMAAAPSASAEVKVIFTGGKHYPPPPPKHHYEPHWPSRNHVRTVVIPVYTEPSAPDNFYVTPRPAGMELSWKKVNGNDYGYYVLRSDNGGRTYEMIQFVSGEVTSFFDNDVKAGVTYYYAVENAYKDGTGGKMSKIIAVKSTVDSAPPVIIINRSAAEPVKAVETVKTADPVKGKVIQYSMVKTAPAPPTKVVAKYIDNAISIVWKSSKDADGYRIYRAAEDQAGNFQKIAETDGTTFEDKNVDRSLQYFYYIAAFNKNGESAKSRIASAFDSTFEK